MLGLMDCFGLTDVGRERASNEDQFLIADLNKSMRVHQTSLGLDHQTRLFGGSQAKLMLVADGMGGAAAGERASTIAIDTITRYVLNTMDWFFRQDDEHEDELMAELKSSLEEVQQQIVSEVEKVPQRQGMGTTLTMAYLIWPKLYVVHAGDSRCYVLRDRDLRQITRDHTVAQQFLDGGALQPEDVAESHWSHVLWNVLGGDSDKLQIDLYRLNLQLGDTLLLCTDGVSAELSPDRIRELLQARQSAETTATELVEAANRAGGRDNITAIVARFVDRDDQTACAEAEAELAETEVYEYAGGNGAKALPA